MKINMDSTALEKQNRFFRENQVPLSDALSRFIFYDPTTQAKTKKKLREYVYGSRGMDDIISVTITPYTRVNKGDISSQIAKNISINIIKTRSHNTLLLCSYAHHAPRHHRNG